ncbi:MAG: HD domain-containing protein [Deltaproteobacteria bacterium]|nr:HD domain-containing protein [Deltaproteobacteria bacterium]
MAESRTGPQDPLRRILEVTEELNNLKDLDAILDRVLLEARAMARADAGSIFLVEDGQLAFSYIHNDTLFPANEANKLLYSDQKIDINDKSMAGYVALTGEPLVIDDAYHIPAERPFSFNRSFDQEAGYRTTSVLTVPLRTSRDKIVGVLQVINALDDGGRVVPFSPEDQLYVTYFANNAAVAIERAQMTREIILRMIRMAEMRDPKETGAHVNRVAAISAEIYHEWASRHNVPVEEIKQTKDLLRIAAMLHDVGKVAISDVILKKPGKLDPDEYEVMKHHTTHGAGLFRDPTSDLDLISAEIALNHHQRWDGRGYPGQDKAAGDETDPGPAKKGQDIPLLARIVGLADVFDALGSKRVYKDAWPRERVLEIIREEAGQQFDPEVVEAFLAIFDTVQAIQNKFKD